MKNLRLALCAFVGLSVAAGTVHGQIIASAGFNDASGINSNPTPNSPYNVNNQPLLGQGAGEPGWFTPWNNALGVGNVVNTNTQEGDGAVLMQGTNIANRVLAQPLTGLRTVATSLQILSSATSGNGVNFYLRQQSTGAIGPNWQLSGDGRIRVVAGNESGSTPLVDTGFLWTPGQYQVFGTHVNTATRRWMLSVDGVFFPMELGYREAPVFIDTVDFLNGVGAPNGTMIDNVIVQVPEPTSLALFGIAVSGFVAAVRRQTSTSSNCGRCA
jgi:hypothetical protein